MKNSEEQGLPNKPMRLAQNVYMRQFGLDIGVYNPETKITYMLNPTAGLIINYLPTGKPYDEIIQNIDIAYGESCDDIEKMRHDLFDTVKFLLKHNLVEVKDSVEDSEIPEDVVITEKQMTSLPMDYMPPKIKGYTIEELQQECGNVAANFLDTYNTDPRASFSDTWNPDTTPSRKANFLDIYKPEINYNPSRHFIDTWLKPRENMQRTKFLDVWLNPGDQNSPRTSFLDTWNPTENNMIRFHDTWKDDPLSVNPMFLDLMRPNTHAHSPVNFLDTWSPNRPSSRFCDTWNPAENGNKTQQKKKIKKKK